MVVLPPGGDGDGEGRDGWIASAWRNMVRPLPMVPPSSRFRYEPIGETRERDGGNARGSSSSNNTRRKQGGSSSISGGSCGGRSSGRCSGGPRQKRLFSGALLCAAGLVVTVNIFQRYSSASRPPPPPPSSSSSSRSSSLPPSQPKATGSREEAVFFAADATATTTRGSSVGGGAWGSHSTSFPRSWDVRVSNKYQTTTDRDGQKQKLMYPWGHIAEPYADTRLEVANFFTGDEDDAGGVKFR